MNLYGVPDSPLGRMYQEHVQYLLQKDLNNLLHQYSEDSLLISTLTKDKTPSYFHGPVELEEFYKNRLFGLEDLSIQIAQWAETETALMIVQNVKWIVSGQTVECSLYDSWILRDGRIAIHLTGAIRYPDGTYADSSVKV